MTNYRKKFLALGKGLPWAIWREQREGLSVKFDEGQLQVKYRFRESPDDSLTYLIQSTLISDAAIRLQGIRDMLKTICKGKPSLVLDKSMRNCLMTPQLTSRKFGNQDSKASCLAGGPSPFIAHGEIADPRYREKSDKKKFINFRESTLYNYRLADIAEACLGVWKELVQIVKIQLDVS